MPFMWVSIHTDTQKAGGARPTGRYIDILSINLLDYMFDYELI